MAALVILNASISLLILPSLVPLTNTQIMSNISCLLAPSAFSISTAMPMLLHSSRLSMTSSYQSCRLFFPSVLSLFPSTPVTLTSSLTSLWISQTALTSSQSGPSSDQTSAETTSDRAPGFCPRSHPGNYFIQLPFYFLCGTLSLIFVLNP